MPCKESVICNHDTFPKIPVTQPFLPPFEEYVQEIKEIWETNWLTNGGPKHQKFESLLKKHLKVEHANLFVNGTLALDLAIKALNLNGEIITTPFTFAATTHAITLNNLKPIFCDIELETFNIDSTKIEHLINENTSAIMPVHVFGNPCNVLEIERIAQKYDLKIIYDAAHAFGVEINGEAIGNFGDVSMFSMHATKVFHSIEGGALTFKDKNLMNIFNKLKNFGIESEDSVSMIGTNAKMNEFQAAMGIVNLQYIDDLIMKRKELTFLYRELLENVKGIKVHQDLPNVKHNYSYLPILIEYEFGRTRDELYEYLTSNGVYCRKYFYPLCSDFDCYKNNVDNSDLFNAQYVAERILTLPLYPQMKKEDVSRICQLIRN